MFWTLQNLYRWHPRFSRDKNNIYCHSWQFLCPSKPFQNVEVGSGGSCLGALETHCVQNSWISAWGVMHWGKALFLLLSCILLPFLILSEKTCHVPICHPEEEKSLPNLELGKVNVVGRKVAIHTSERMESSWWSQHHWQRAGSEMLTGYSRCLKMWKGGDTLGQNYCKVPISITKLGQWMLPTLLLKLDLG